MSGGETYELFMRDLSKKKKNRNIDFEIQNRRDETMEPDTSVSFWQLVKCSF